MEFNDLEKELAGIQWNPRNMKALSTELFWTWYKEYRIDDDRDAYLGLDKCFNFDKDIWFELVNCM